MRRTFGGSRRVNGLHCHGLHCLRCLWAAPSSLSAREHSAPLIEPSRVRKKATAQERRWKRVPTTTIRTGNRPTGPRQCSNRTRQPRRRTAPLRGRSPRPGWNCPALRRGGPLKASQFAFSAALSIASSFADAPLCFAVINKLKSFVVAVPMVPLVGERLVDPLEEDQAPAETASHVWLRHRVPTSSDAGGHPSHGEVVRR